MEVILSRNAEKYLNKMNEPHKSKIKLALKGLTFKPPKGDVKTLEGTDKYRLRAGNYRILFRILSGKILVSGIHPRGQAYKGENIK